VPRMEPSVAVDPGTSRCWSRATFSWLALDQCAHSRLGRRSHGGRPRSPRRAAGPAAALRHDPERGWIARITNIIFDVNIWTDFAALGLARDRAAPRDLLPLHSLLRHDVGRSSATRCGVFSTQSLAAGPAARRGDAERPPCSSTQARCAHWSMPTTRTWPGTTARQFPDRRHGRLHPGHVGPPLRLPGGCGPITLEVLEVASCPPRLASVSRDDTLDTGCAFIGRPLAAGRDRRGRAARNERRRQLPYARSRPRLYESGETGETVAFTPGTARA